MEKIKVSTEEVKGCALLVFMFIMFIVELSASIGIGVLYGAGFGFLAFALFGVVNAMATACFLLKVNKKDKKLRGKDY